MSISLFDLQFDYTRQDQTRAQPQQVQEVHQVHQAQIVVDNPDINLESFLYGSEQQNISAVQPNDHSSQHQQLPVAPQDTSNAMYSTTEQHPIGADSSLLTVSPYQMNFDMTTGTSIDSSLSDEGFALSPIYSPVPIPAVQFDEYILDNSVEPLFEPPATLGAVAPATPVSFASSTSAAGSTPIATPNTHTTNTTNNNNNNTTEIYSSSSSTHTSGYIDNNGYTSETTTEKPLASMVAAPESPVASSPSMPTPPPEGLDFNGRKPRKWKNRKYKCSHCSLSFLDKDLDLYAAHVEQVEKQKNGIQLTRRKYKCADETCPWHKIGFLRKLEAQKHFVRKHGVPKFECRFWCEEGEKIPGCGVCTTRWHADSGNRSRHEQAIHGRLYTA